MSTLPLSRSNGQHSPDVAGPVDHALTLLLADETEAALRWGAAALEQAPQDLVAVVVTSRLLERMGRMRAATEGLRLAVRQAVERNDLPLAVVAIEDLRALGVEVTAEVEELAAAFCRESTRLQPAPAQVPSSEFGHFQPLSPFLAGPSLASKATQILNATKRTHDETVDPEKPMFAPLPLFSALSKAALHELLTAFTMITVPAGHRVVEEGELMDTAYVVAQGELEISRRADGKARRTGDPFRGENAESSPPVVLTRITSGGFFGEIAAVSKLPAPSTVTATRPSILLVAKRSALEAIAAKYPEAAVQLAAHCRRHMVTNLGWTSPVIAAMPARERTALVERLEMRFFDPGEKLVQYGEDAAGLHLIVSGGVAVVGRDGRESVLLASLGPGETVGEVELVLCRKANAEAIAQRGTATLFLSRDDFFELVGDHQAILYGLYAIAVRRYNETQLALQTGSSHVADSLVLELDETYGGSYRSQAANGIRRSPASNRVRMPSHVDTPPGPTVAPVAVAPTIFVQDSAPTASQSRSRYFEPETLLPPDGRVSETPRSPRVGPGVRTGSTSSRSLAPFTATMPSSRPALRRSPSPARKAVRAVGVAAAAAGIMAAALVASRDTHTGGALGSAAAAAGRELAAPPADNSANANGVTTTPAPAEVSVTAISTQKASRLPATIVAPKGPTANASARASARQSAAVAPAPSMLRASDQGVPLVSAAPSASMASRTVPAVPSITTPPVVAIAPIPSTAAIAPAAAPATNGATTVAPVPSATTEPKQTPSTNVKSVDDEFGGRQ